MANEAETSSNQSWRRRLDDRWTCRDHDRVGRHPRPGALSESELPADSLIPGPNCRLERLDIRSMDSAVCYQYPRRGTVLARLCPAASGGSLGTRSMVGKRHSVVPVPLESRLADRRDVAADRADAPVDCAAEAEHHGGHHHSRGIQRRRLRPRHQRARRSLGSSDMIAPAPQQERGPRTEMRKQLDAHDLAACCESACQRNRLLKGGTEQYSGSAGQTVLTDLRRALLRITFQRKASIRV